MSIQIALLRGINVGGRSAVTMADLRELFEALEYAHAKTLLQSGNVVFDGGRLTGAALERQLETETAKRFEMSTDYFIRSAAEWKKIVDRNPFPTEAKNDPGHLVVMFLKASPQARHVDDLQASVKGPEVIRRDGKQLYIVYPAGIGRSKLSGTLIERKLGIRGTSRNWNTVLKLAALCSTR
jgi:uncharacterized protein (DUF1697 family)